MTSDGEGKNYRYCANHQYQVCNWLIPVESNQKFCIACNLNRTIPYLADRANFWKWQKLERAKHRLIYQLLRLKLPIISKSEDTGRGFCFDFISRNGDFSLMTGHASGVITILLAEADSVHLEKMRRQLMEPYRTLIGHFRHEVGHYFWDSLVASDQGILDDFRRVFGDERKDYGQALKHYYQTTTAADWQENYISQYATAHPWEDWAETWAHYLHIMDMSGTAHSFGLSVSPHLDDIDLKGSMGFDPYTVDEFSQIFKAWFPISFAINSLNRSMGVPDLYPFVVSKGVVQKMKFIHQLLFRNR